MANARFDRIKSALFQRRPARSDDPAARKRGQSLVEFAFALPFMLLIMLGTIDMGQMFFEYIQLRGAVREGASHGARNPFDETGTIYAVTRHSEVMADGLTTVTVNVYGDLEVYGDATIVVSATRTFQPLTTSFLGRFGMGPVTMTANASAKVWT